MKSQVVNKFKLRAQPTPTRSNPLTPRRIQIASLGSRLGSLNKDSRNSFRKINLKFEGRQVIKNEYVGAIFLI